MPRSIVVYHYFEADEGHRDNLAGFLRHGYDEDLDYVFIIAGGCTLELPQAKNLKFVHVANAGNDFAGYALAVNSVVSIQDYDYFIFLNSSVSGPFLPAYCRTPWHLFFTGMLTGDVHLAGSTINILSPMSPYSNRFAQRYGGRGPFAHVQSMSFVIDRTALEYLVARNFFGRPFGPEKADVITDYELLLSQLVIRNGWNITCLLPEYAGRDYRTIAADINPNSADGDPCFARAYFGRTLHPYEVIFIKANRNVVPHPYLRSIEGSLTSSVGAADRSALTASPFDRVMNGIQSAWKGHRNFAIWLVNRLQPHVTVDLGVDFGFSTFCFAYPGIGHVYGIDAFEGDEHAGFRDTRSNVADSIDRLAFKNITLIKGYFEDVAKTWTRPIDILHVDGRHHYEDAKTDFSTWFGFLSAGGVALLHDTCVPSFGVRRLFGEITLPKCNFLNSHGLGVVSRDQSLIHEIERKFALQLEPLSAIPAGLPQ